MSREEAIIVIPTSPEAKIACLEAELREVWKKIGEQEAEIAFLKRKIVKRKYLRDNEYLDIVFSELAFGRQGLSLLELSRRMGRSKLTLKRLMPQIRQDDRFRIGFDRQDPQKVIIYLKKWS